MWTDNETSIDYLGFHHLVGALLEIVRAEDLLPATVGVYGNWGSGKSSLLQMAREELEKEEGTLVLSFNGWLFEGYEDAKTALMGTILEEVADRKTLTAKGKEKLFKLFARVNVMRAAGAAARFTAGFVSGGLPGMALSAVPDAATFAATLLEKSKDIKPEELGQFLREQVPTDALRRGVREFRNDFAALLDETKLKRLVVFVDDLDRCTPDTIIETLEAIKLFLFVPRTAFVLGADERLIRYAVRRRFPELPGDNVEVGRDYLEKLIQFPIRIPPMGRAETDSYIKLLLARTCDISDHAFQTMRMAVADVSSRLDATLDRKMIVEAFTGSVPLKVSEAMALAEQISPVLASGLLGNPRQCKRFLNTLIIRVKMGESRSVSLKRKVLAKLMLLEYLRPESFKELARLQASSDSGMLTELRDAENAARGVSAASARSESESAPGATAIRNKSAGALSSVNPLSQHLAGPFGAWASDKWLAEWLKAEPILGSEDLSPYLYFARETLDPIVRTAFHMSPEAKELLTKIISDSDVQRTNALNAAEKLSPADAGAILEALMGRARETEELSSDANAPLSLMCSWVDKRSELLGELVAFLKSLPHTGVPIGIVPRVAGLNKDTGQKISIEGLLQSWATGQHSPLRKAASNSLTRLANK